MVNIDPDLPNTVFFDSLRLKQVLINLLANATKFTENGSITLSITKTNCNERECSIRFSVADTGIGMSKEVMEKIFKPFVQGDSSTTRKYGGTGLGLTISRMLVEKMNATLLVNSEVKSGSEFYFVLKTLYR